MPGECHRVTRRALLRALGRLTSHYVRAPIIGTLASRPGHLFSRDELLFAAYGFHEWPAPEAKSLTRSIHDLRRLGFRIQSHSNGRYSYERDHARFP